MKTVDVYSLGTPGTFSIPEGCLMPNTERLSYELSYMLYSMNSQGMTISQGESSDTSYLSGFIESLSEDLNSWLVTNIPVKVGGGEITPFVMPDFPVAEIIAAILSGNASLAVSAIASWLISSITSNWVSSIPPESGEIGELKEVLEKGLLTADKENALMLLLANTPIQVVVESLKGYWDTHLGPE